MYRILSFDGGGIRGAFTSHVLDRICHEVDIVKDTDLFAGTSTGGIIALGLAFGLSPAEITDLYFKEGKNIFSDSLIDDILDLGSTIGASYSNRNLKKILKRKFGDACLGDLSKKVLIPTFKLKSDDKTNKSWRAKFFHNFEGSEDLNESLVSITLRTTAAPTYFPTFEGYIDGGVIANDPSMAALCQAIDPRYGNKKLEEIRLLSIGTGINVAYMNVGVKEKDQKDYGAIQWAKPIINIMLDGGMFVAAYQAQQLLGNKYLKVNMVLPDKIDMDDVSALPKLIDTADLVSINNVLEWLHV